MRRCAAAFLISSCFAAVSLACKPQDGAGASLKEDGEGAFAGPSVGAGGGALRSWAFHLRAKGFIAYIAGNNVGAFAPAAFGEGKYQKYAAKAGLASAAWALKHTALANARLKAFSLSTNLMFNENPRDGERHPDYADYRLFASLDLSATCDGAKLQDLRVVGQDSHAGKEPAKFGVFQARFSPLAVVGPTKDGYVFFQADGAPPTQLEPGFQGIALRDSTHIWYNVLARVTCDADGTGRIETKPENVKTTIFPSFRLWVNGKVVIDRPQQEFVALWSLPWAPRVPRVIGCDAAPASTGLGLAEPDQAPPAVPSLATVGDPGAPPADAGNIATLQGDACERPQAATPPDDADGTAELAPDAAADVDDALNARTDYCRLLAAYQDPAVVAECERGLGVEAGK